ncbi:hypothetical protein [Cohnella sp. AR92]|uniref:hypothetical protein n=1 Tax=Cohnella sp. AR92 TaxID=648716 RepID=UPI000F8F2E3C|nr:hypothetical protein [Cohnella sp. AR92]RUS45591.1 hypothetical protein ELR57_19805 [Cohnella sp. AR92]
MTNEKLVEAFIEEQKRGATGQRLELLNKDLTGTKKLLSSILLPVLKSLDGLILEHEMVSNSGVRMYVDAFYVPLGIGFEAEGYIAHEEKLTRERFSFERVRIRTIGNRRFVFYPFSWDEMDKRAEACRRDVYELLGSMGSLSSSRLLSLPAYEREVLRFAVMRLGAFGLQEVQELLQLGYKSSRRAVNSLLEKGHLLTKGGGDRRCFEFIISQSGRDLFLDR